MIECSNGYWQFIALELHQKGSKRKQIINFLSGISDQRGVKVNIVYIVEPIIGDYLPKFINDLAKNGVVIKVYGLALSKNANELEKISQADIFEKISLSLNSGFNIELPEKFNMRDLVIICQ